MLKNQSDKFSLPSNVTYINCAYMAPLLKEAEQLGLEAIRQKAKPYEIVANDFFTHTKKVKQLFSQLVNIPDYQNVAIIPSVSYGIATVANNVVLTENDEVLVIEEQFPSNIYSWKSLVKKYNAKLKIVKAPALEKGRGALWNRNILDAITKNTKVVAIPNIHWSDGTLFDLKAIREKTYEHKSLLIIDGTQSVGALPFSVKDIKPDALICAGYKWLLGHYAMGLAYFSDELCKGTPIEENWINRKNSEYFAGLVTYQDDYQPKAGRFNMGEMSNFALNPMLTKSIEQILDWGTENIQAYCKEITLEATKELERLGCFVEDENCRSNHLFGVYLPKHIDLDKLKEQFAKNNIFVSFRGNAIRISPHLYNTKEDLNKLVKCFKNI